MELTEQQKKLLFIGLFIAAVAAMAYLLYAVFFRSAEPEPVPTININGVNVALPDVEEYIANANTPVQPNTNTEPIGLPGIDPVASGGLTSTDVLVDKEVQELAASSDGSLRFYDKDDGRFYRVSQDGEEQQIGIADFPGVENVTWADTSNEVILEFPDGSNIYYDLEKNVQVTLPKEYEEFDFSPNSSQIAFKYMHIDSERRVLAVASPNGSGARTLESLGENADRVTVEWSPTGKVAASHAKFIDLNRQEVGFVGLNGENWKTTIVEGRGLRTMYSSDGKQMLYSVYSSATDNKPSLWLVDADGADIGRNRRELQINTFADKCAITESSNTAYCAVPSKQISGYGLVPELVDDVPDDIYKIDLITGSKTKVAIPVNENGQAIYTVDQMIVNDTEDKLFFRDTVTGKLIKLNL